MSIQLFLFLSVLNLPLQLFAQKQPTIVKDGAPQFSIVLSVKPADVEEKAALLLQSAIQKMSGSKLEIVKADQPNIQHAIYIMPSKFPQQLKDVYKRQV